MQNSEIKAHKIKTPIQLLAVWFAALVLLNGELLGAAALIDRPDWVSPLLAVAAVAAIPVCLFAAFMMQTRFRPHLQEDAYYAPWLERREQHFIQIVAAQSKQAAPQPTDAWRDALDTVSRSQRLMLILIEWEEMTMAEVASTLDVSVTQATDMYAAIPQALKALVRANKEDAKRRGDWRKGPGPKGRFRG